MFCFASKANTERKRPFRHSQICCIELIWCGTTSRSHVLGVYSAVISTEMFDCVSSFYFVMFQFVLYLTQISSFAEVCALCLAIPCCHSNLCLMDLCLCGVLRSVYLDYLCGLQYIWISKIHTVEKLILSQVLCFNLRRFYILSLHALSLYFTREHRSFYLPTELSNVTSNLFFLVSYKLKLIFLRRSNSLIRSMSMSELFPAADVYFHTCSICSNGGGRLYNKSENSGGTLKVLLTLITSS